LDNNSLVLVTGGAGFIGSHIVETLVTRGIQVRVTDNLSNGSLANLEHVLDKIGFMELDLSDYAAAQKAVDGVTEIVHLAALQGVQESIVDPVAATRHGINITANILQAGRKAGINRVVFASSVSVYGNTGSRQNLEDLPYNPMSPYAACKVAGELYVRIFSEVIGLDGVCLRFSNVFGPRQPSTGAYSGVISLFARLLREGKRPTVFGDGRQSRDFVYVTDIAKACLLALECHEPLHGQAMNIGFGKSITLLQLIKTMNHVLGTSVEPVFQPARAGDILHSGVSIEKARRVLGFEPETSLEQGLQLTIGPK